MGKRIAQAAPIVLYDNGFNGTSITGRLLPLLTASVLLALRAKRK